jgi:hypothetical protein
MDTDCTEDRKQINDKLQHLYILGILCSTRNCLVHWIDKDICKILSAMEFIANILQFTQYLISSILDLLKGKCDRYITGNIQQSKVTYRHFRKCFFEMWLTV